MNFATLYIVATPIGNLEDVTLRALRVLKEVDVIFCEDTRETRKLLTKYEIKTPTESLNVRTEADKAERVIRLLSEGKNIAYVSDAGTPGVSDPGAMLVRRVREHFESDKVQSADWQIEPCRIESVPGPSALAAAISVAGAPLSQFTFLGFLPHKKGRETLFKEIAAAERPVIFYESPHRILKTLESLQKFTPQKKVTICRELTKIHEEIVSGAPAELLQFFAKNPEKVRGEFVVIVI